MVCEAGYPHFLDRPADPAGIGSGHAYGGQGVEGHTYRWRHGTVVRLRTTDTWETLGEDAEVGYTRLDAALEGRDDTRPILAWAPERIESLAGARGEGR